MAERPWYHSGLTRVAAEEMLVNSGKDGAFLIRDSDSISNALVLCLMYQSRVHHYRIYLRNNKYSVQTVVGVNQVYRETLDELVSYYGTPGAGLVHHLQYPIDLDVENDSSDDSDTEDSSGPVIKPRGYVAIEQHQQHQAAASSPSGSFEDNEYADVSSVVSTSSARNISKFFEQNFKTLNTSGVDDAFVERVHSYATDGALMDLEFVMSQSEKPFELHKLVFESGAEAFRQLQKYTRQLTLLANFFDHCSGLKGAAQGGDKALVPPNESAPLEFSEAVQRLTACQEILQSIDTKATSLMKTVGGSYTGTPSTTRHHGKTLSSSTLHSGTDRTSSTSSSGVVQSFETRTDYQLKSKTILTVDVDAGILTISRGEKDTMTYTCGQVVQIIKSRSAKQKLGIRIDGKTRKDFAFNDNKSREVFCLLMQQMQKKHTNESDVSNISIFVGSFNMADAPCPNDLQSWFKCQGLGKTLDESVTCFGHDMYVIGTQESGGMGDKDWKSVIYQCTGIEMKLVDQATLWGIRLVILVKPEHFNKISHVQTSTVRTGVANTLGNKGAVAVSLHFGGTSLCFICAHLTSGTEKCVRRNNNYRDILRFLQLGQRSLQQFDLTSQFHHVFWFGDLNYRLQCEDEAGAVTIVKHIRDGNLGVLHEMDQLRREKDMGHVFCSFEEEALDFPPTYRYERGTRKVYSWRKEKKMSVRINVPSWCDRVLWKSYPRTLLQNTSYGCTTDIVTSDHSPVFATFNMGIVTQTAPKAKGPSNSTTYVHFTHAAALIGSSSKTAYYLEVHSECLNSSSRSVNNTSCLTSEQQTDIRKSCPRVLRHLLHDTCFPEWSHSQLEKMSLQPILADEEYLMHQHFFIAVKSADGDEVYGGGLIAAVDYFAHSPVDFGIELTRHGKATGYLKGSLYIPVTTTRANPYDDVSLISEETDMERPPLPHVPAPASPRSQRSYTFTESTPHPAQRPPMQPPGSAGAAPVPQPSDLDAARPPPTAAPRPPSNPPLPFSRRSTPGMGSLRGNSSRGNTPVDPRGAAAGPNRQFRSRTTAGPDRIRMDEEQTGSPRSEDLWQGKVDERPPLPINDKPPIPIKKTMRPSVDLSATGAPPLPPANRADVATTSSRPPLPAPSASGARQPQPLPPSLPHSASQPLPPPPHAPGHSALMRSRSSQIAGQGGSSLRTRPSVTDVSDSMVVSPPTSLSDLTPPLASAPLDKDTPTTVTGFLQILGLSRYVEGFLTEGWDNVEFLTHMGLGDLRKCGVTSGAHQRQIMEAIRTGFLGK